MRQVRLGGKGSATFALASMETTVVSARAFVVGRFMAGTTADSGRIVARRLAVLMFSMFARRFIFTNFAFASVITTIVSAHAFVVGRFMAGTTAGSGRIVAR